MRRPDSKPFVFVTLSAVRSGARKVRRRSGLVLSWQHGCPPQIVGRIVHFISRKAMDIEGIGEETAALFYSEGMVRDVADLYDLKPEQVAVLPRLGEKSAANIMESLLRSREFGTCALRIGHTVCRRDDGPQPCGAFQEPRCRHGRLAGGARSGRRGGRQDCRQYSGVFRRPGESTYRRAAAGRRRAIRSRRRAAALRFAGRVAYRYFRHVPPSQPG